ncbi:DNA replication complex GINS family protein [Candidatus Pacearchaeota archaeon]|nr:DNA replication complex GINS family protein [Candidatus Pacearchaeota archaeon]
MITYNDIYEALRKERYSEQLQPLSSRFVKDVVEYLDEKKDIPGKEENLFSDIVIKSKKQLENAVSIFRELILRRKKKILNLVFIAAETGLSKRDFENMLPFEKILFERIMEVMELSDKELNKMMRGEAEEVAKHSLIVFKESVEEFLDLEGNKTGPFEKGDIASLSSEIAKILVDGNKADYVEGESRSDKD